ncbi:MFS transporter [Streptomyces sp. V2]|nr:MFS transporter [Streptomyces sp. V2]
MGLRGCLIRHAVGDRSDLRGSCCAGRLRGVPAAAHYGGDPMVPLITGLFELRVKEPPADLRTSARRQALFTNVASITVGFSLYMTILIVPQFLRLPAATGYGLGKSLLTAGLVMAPMGLVMMATAPVSGRVTRARGPKTTLMIGALIVAAGYGLNIVLMNAVWHFVLVSCIVGAGVGFAFGAMPALIMGAVPASETGAANSLNTLMRAIGTSFASAVAAVILSQMTTRFDSVALPSENGFKTVMAVGGGAGLLAFALASFIPRHRPATATADTASESATPSAIPGGTATPATVTVEKRLVPAPQSASPQPVPVTASAAATTSGARSADTSEVWRGRPWPERR